MMSDILSSSQHRIATHSGNIHAQVWHSEQPNTPIILMHDSLGSVQQWRDFPAQLAAHTGRSVLAYDRVGYGSSEAFPGKQPLSFIADEALVFTQVYAHFGLHDFVIYGHSVGGPISAVIAAHYPQSCRALITEASQAFVETKTLDGIRAAEAFFSQPRHFDKLAKYHGDKTEWVLRSWIDNWLDPAFADWQVSQYFDALHCPILSVHGEVDEYGSTAQAERYRLLSQQANQVVILPECGHFPHKQQPEQVLNHVAAFLVDK